MLINESTLEFIRRHADDDVRLLALHGTKDNAVNMTMALQQIAGRQTARRKLPSWAATDNIVYPPHLNMEQCSSEQTARYKARVAGKGDTLVDLTGGFGVDFYWMSQGFQERIYVERNADLCAIMKANMATLGHSCQVNQGDTSAYLATITHASVIYLDPARRNEHGSRTYDIADCTPNVLEPLPLLIAKADKIILKLSPMLDWRKSVEDIEHTKTLPQAHVTEVHIVSVDNECKELLLVISQEQTESLRLVCVNNEQEFVTIQNQQTTHLKPTNSAPEASEFPSPLYLYEPNASVMKAGCFDELTQRYQVSPVAPNSHLFLSSVEIADFPGRKFQISSISSMNKKDVKQTLSEIFGHQEAPLKRANISVRNFPLSADALRQRLQLKDGGDIYIIATTLANGQHRLFFCRKIG